MPLQDPTLGPFIAIIDGPPLADRRTLRLTVVINHAVPPVPNVPLSLALRLPNNEDVIVPARRISPDVVEGDFPEAPVGADQYVLARPVMEAGGRLETLSLPVGGYAWVSGAPTAIR